MAEAQGSCTAVICEQSPFFPLSGSPAQTGTPPGLESSTLMRKLLPTVYSGPTIGDIETALAMSGKGAGEPGGRCSTRPAVPVLEKGFNAKMENKYTLRIKCCANRAADDGYKWRKYGQKSIKNSPNPRSYYRCTNPRCSAKKQVERSVEDPETLVVTYEGLHLHYAYSHYLLSRPRDFSTSPTAASLLPKRNKLEMAETAPRDSTPDSPVAAGPSTPFTLTAPQPLAQQVGEDQAVMMGLEEGDQRRMLGENPREDVPRRPQGLLEDIVPLLVRKPCSGPLTATLTVDPASFSSVPSSPPSSSSSFNWPHSPTYLDHGALFGTVQEADDIAHAAREGIEGGQQINHLLCTEEPSHALGSSIMHS